MRRSTFCSWFLLSMLLSGPVCESKEMDNEDEQALPDLATLFKTLFKADLDDFLAEADAQSSGRDRHSDDHVANSDGYQGKRADVEKKGINDEEDSKNDQNEDKHQHETKVMEKEGRDDLLLKDVSRSNNSSNMITESEFASIVNDLRDHRPAQPSLIRRAFILATDEMNALADVSRRIAFAKQHKRHTSTRCPSRRAPECDASLQVPPLDGRCNNVKHPFFGSVLQPYRRLLKPDYGDKYITPRGSTYQLGEGYKSRLPNARAVSVAMHGDRNVSDNGRTHLFMQFGQFVDHDITATAKEDLPCCASDARLLCVCFPVSLLDDSHFSSMNRSCMQFTRSSFNCRSESPWVEQFNGVSSFLDLSHVYGLTHHLNDRLRSGNRDGLLATNPRFGAFDLPRRSHVDLGHPHRHRPVDDFATGDTRANAQPTLLAMHNVFLREHNRVAANIADRIRKGGREELKIDERELDRVIFGVARRVLIAQFQNIVYNEFLPTLLGETIVKQRRLNIDNDSEYDQHVDATVTNEFATAAFRYGHSSAQAVFEGRDQPWRLSRGLGSAHFAIKDGGRGFENEMAGAAAQPQQTIDRFVTDELTNKLFANERLLGNKPAAESAASDLIATNIQRGRDHGLPSYNAYRQLVGLARISDMTTRPEEIDEPTWRQLNKVYDNIDDIDLYTAGLLEKPIPGGAVGPTFAFIIGEQFEALKHGDRFFFTHKHSNSQGLPFAAQKVAMKRRLSDILCDNVPTISKIQMNVFRMPDQNDNPIMECSDHKQRARLNFQRIVDTIVREVTRNQTFPEQRDEEVVTTDEMSENKQEDSEKSEMTNDSQLIPSNDHSPIEDHVEPTLDTTYQTPQVTNMQGQRTSNEGFQDLNSSEQEIEISESDQHSEEQRDSYQPQINVEREESESEYHTQQDHEHQAETFDSDTNLVMENSLQSSEMDNEVSYEHAEQAMDNQSEAPEVVEDNQSFDEDTSYQTSQLSDDSSITIHNEYINELSGDEGHGSRDVVNDVAEVVDDVPEMTMGDQYEVESSSSELQSEENVEAGSHLEDERPEDHEELVSEGQDEHDSEPLEERDQSELLPEQVSDAQSVSSEVHPEVRMESHDDVDHQEVDGHPSADEQPSFHNADINHSDTTTSLEIVESEYDVEHHHGAERTEMTGGEVRDALTALVRNDDHVINIEESVRENDLAEH